MTKPSIQDRLKQLAQDNKKRSKTARLRDNYEDIETAIAAGVPLSEILVVLNEAGIDMTLDTFKNALYRIRKSNGRTQTKKLIQQQEKTATAIAIAATSKVEAGHEETEIQQEVKSSTNPADIDAILNSTPDLEALAKAGRKSTQGKGQKR